MDPGGQGQLPEQGDQQHRPAPGRDHQRHHPLPLHLTGGNYELSPPMEKGLRVSLIRRFLSDQLEFINIAKNHIEVRHFYDLIQRIIYPANGYGRLGGQERRAVPGPEDPLQAGRPCRRPERAALSQDLVHHHRRHHELPQLQQPGGGERAEVQGDRPDPPGIPERGPAVQELPFPHRDRQGPVHGPRRPGRQAADRAQLQPPGRPHGHGLLREVQEPVPGQPGHASRSGWTR